MDQNTRRFEDNTDEDQPTQKLADAQARPPRPARSCPRCQGEMMDVEVSVPGASGHINVKRPGTWIGIISGGVSQVGAFTCKSCGFVDLYALDLEELLRQE